MKTIGRRRVQAWEPQGRQTSGPEEQSFRMDVEIGDEPDKEAKYADCTTSKAHYILDEQIIKRNTTMPLQCKGLVSCLSVPTSAMRCPHRLLPGAHLRFHQLCGKRSPQWTVMVASHRRDPAQTRKNTQPSLMILKGLETNSSCNPLLSETVDTMLPLL